MFKKNKMKIEISENGQMILKEIYAPIGIKTNSNETIILMMRDSGFEMFYENNYFSLQKGEIKSAKQIREESNKYHNKTEDEYDSLSNY
jgi:hypothetical protein